MPKKKRAKWEFMVGDRVYIHETGKCFCLSDFCSYTYEPDYGTVIIDWGDHLRVKTDNQGLKSVRKEHLGFLEEQMGEDDPREG